MGRHMRNHEVGAATRTGTTRPAWPTIDRQPTEPFSVTGLARCQHCGDALWALAGGTWASKRSNGETAAICPKAPWRPWRTGRAHVLSAGHPSSPWSSGWLLVLLLVFGPTAMLVAIAVASYLVGR